MSAPRTPGGPVARKRFGQNFLEPAWVVKVIRAIDPQPDQTFVEIGPGRGALTRELTARAKAVVAYEIDRDLAAALRATAPPNLTIVEGDFLEIASIPGDDTPDRAQIAEHRANPEARIPNRIRAAGNLPYNVASPILFKLAELYVQGAPIIDATVMLQREVADRLTAEPGTKDYGVLTVLMRHAAHVTRLLALPPGAFRPAPKVHSSLVRLTFHGPDPPVRDLAVFRTVVRSVFTRRRKTLANALLALQELPDSKSKSESRSDAAYLVSSRLTPAMALDRALIDGTRRPETLSIAEFARLAEVYASISP
jgi:16S rRNA (adenine1518-N6/adenine1519-N6)-dimethyltransferase